VIAVILVLHLVLGLITAFLYNAVYDEIGEALLVGFFWPLFWLFCVLFRDCSDRSVFPRARASARVRHKERP